MKKHAYEHEHVHEEHHHDTHAGHDPGMMLLHLPSQSLALQSEQS